jgi:hypothetical protein
MLAAFADSMRATLGELRVATSESAGGREADCRDASEAVPPGSDRLP